jgi:hypothetical protein
LLEYVLLTPNWKLALSNIKPVLLLIALPVAQRMVEAANVVGVFDVIIVGADNNAPIYLYLTLA